MHYPHVCRARFVARPNRFVARVALPDGTEQVVHVKNTGRCRELLVPGAPVYLAESGNPLRKTRYDLIAVEKGPLLVNLDSQAPNRVFAEWAQAGGFRPGLTLLRPETRWGNSRFDFYWEDADGAKGFVEVKGVTLEEGGHARFPDAPTQRGVKHLEELLRCRRQGYEAAVCFVVQMSGMADFAPNDATHPAFGEALRRAAAGGVAILARECAVTPDTLTLTRPVAVRL
ncbi:DNA/RNA nuclease SfsA [uncultured Subdoligranulum sp.]|uniref:Sugar fermentation stimulation protein homolog n=1 Tax=Candidatus Gemmiger excrementavium TaxID=2838608 RepID=A0A9D2JFC8_9FIRM|nr:DNA/RNA nuclease SfsA [uncultured Subdoligranulum sp.]HIZ47766.1 DNA/RNA nuclease SfsA [Candidatus Gemmiger excrementavium]